MSIASKGEDALHRHRAARARREAVHHSILSHRDARPEPDDEASRAQAPHHEAAADVAPSANAQIRDARDYYRADPAPDDDQWRPLIDPMKVFGGIVRSRYIIAATTVAGAALGVMIALQTPKLYYSASEMLVDPREIKMIDRDITQGGLPSDATLAIVQNQVRVLTSGTVLQKAVDKLKLDADPEFNGSESGFGIGSIVSELRSLLSRGDGEAGNNRRALAVQNLAKAMTVERGDKTFVVSVGVETQDPAKSALIANTLTGIFLETSGDIQSTTAGRANDELNARLGELRAGVEEAERKVEIYKAEHDLIDAKGGLISDEEILKLNDQLGTARARTIELNARAASARNVDVNSVLAGDLPEQMASPVLTELRSQFTSAKREVDALSVRLGPRHPQFLSAEAQLTGLRGSINLELRRIVSSMQVELKRAVEAEQALASRLAQLKSRQGVVSEDLVALRELERDSASKRAVYESFLLRARETGEQRGLNTANITVISEAQPALLPQGPSRSTRVIIAAILGLMLGIGIGALRGVWDSLRGPDAPGGMR
ncbi:MAG: GumC family protein, partial [Mesorhizobium sp.]